MAPRPNLGASMSSTLIVPAGASTQSPLPQPTNDGNDNSNGGASLQQKGANYFFGFLIAFVVLLLVFVACGITSRRRFLSRRGPVILGTIQPWGSDERVQQTEPVFYERFIGEPPMAEDRWRYTTPLSASLVRGVNESSTEEILESDATTPLRSDVEDSAALSQPTPPERGQLSTTERVFPSSFLPSWMSRSSEPKRRDSLNEKTELMESPEALEVAVVIAMPTRPNPLPSSSSTRRETLSSNQPLLQSHFQPTSHSSLSPIISQVDRNDEKSPTSLPPSHIPSHLPEYQIGLTVVPWHAELNSTSVPASSP